MTKILIAVALSMVSVSVLAYQFPEIDQANCVERELPHYFIAVETVKGSPPRNNGYTSAVHENLTACEVVLDRFKAVLPPNVSVRNGNCLPVRLCHFDQHE